MGVKTKTSFKKGHKFIKGGEKGWFKKGKRPFEIEEKRVEALRKALVGKKHKQKTKEKISRAHLKRWEGKERKQYRTSIHIKDSKYVKWRMAVFNRDNFTCQTCRKIGGELEAHHIKSWSKYIALRFEIDNGITLCKDCHKLTDNYAGRKG